MSYCAIYVTKNMTIARHIIIASQQKIRLTPQKPYYKQIKLVVTFHVVCHIGQIMTRHNHIICQQKNMTIQSHMPHRIGFFSARQVKIWHGLQGQSRHAPRVVGIVDFVFLYAQTTVYIHMTDVQNDSSVMTRPSHHARHLLPLPRESYFGIV